MVSPFEWFLLLFFNGALAGLVLALRLERVDPARLARWFLVAVTFCMAVRTVAYVMANVGGVQAIRALSTGPRDPTNVLVGALYGFAIAHLWRGRLSRFFREPDVLLGVRVAAGVAFVLAGLVNVFLPDLGAGFFVQAGYTRTFRLFMMTAEVLGGAALLLPWRWLTLTAVAGLTIDMFGAIFTQVHLGEPLAQLGPPLVMLLRLAPLAGLVLLTVKHRWVIVALSALGCAAAACLGALHGF